MRFVALYLVVEIVTFIAVGSWLGVGWTLLLLLLGGVVGLWLTRREGVRAAQAVITAIQDRRVAHEELTDGLLIAAGGLFVLLPGFVSDLIGLALLLPPTRSLIRARMVRAAERQAPGLRTARLRGAGPVIDGSVVDGSPSTWQPPAAGGLGLSGGTAPPRRPDGGGPTG